MVFLGLKKEDNKHFWEKKSQRHPQLKFMEDKDFQVKAVWRFFGTKNRMGVGFSPSIPRILRRFGKIGRSHFICIPRRSVIALEGDQAV